jgi:hypothetical protein
MALLAGEMVVCAGKSRGVPGIEGCEYGIIAGSQSITAL